MFNNALKQYFDALHQLQEVIFSFYIKRNFNEDRFRHEKKLLKQTESVMKAMTRVRKNITDEKKLAQLESLYEILFALDLLKDRLIDHSTFEICEQEFINIHHALGLFLKEISEVRATHAKKKLDAAIQALEIHFQNTLQVVSADPMIFVFFIKDLYALSHRLDGLAA